MRFRPTSGVVLALLLGGCVVEFPQRSAVDADDAGRPDAAIGDAAAPTDGGRPETDTSVRPDARLVAPDGSVQDAEPAPDRLTPRDDTGAPPDAGRPDANTGDLGPPPTDGDGDGVPDDVDNCPAGANPDQRDADADRIGDVCDPCPLGGDPTDADDDGFRRCENDCDDSDSNVSPGSVERCNLRDDDCNGTADDPFEASLGAGCVVGLGACERFGVMVCSADGLVALCDAVAAPATPETCNAVDDDCDGSTDEGVDGCCEAGATQACGSAIGVCRPGLQRCEADRRWSACDAAPPGDEVCNALDDDCDGVVDEGTLNACGACGALSPDLCDGLDNDCDGVIDPGYDVDDPCSVGIGACRRAGFIVCTPAGGSACSAIEALPADEICNRLDDDCDGETDEGLLDIGPCTVGVGACLSEGRSSCAAGESFCAAVPGEPGVETCNGLDDDCDGEADEGFGLGEPCEVGQSLCRNTGVIVCDAEGAARCSAEPLPPQPEICNGLDDDCDLEPDDDADCTDYLLAHCRAWLVWADRDLVGEVSDTWDACPAQTEDEDGDVRCVATAPLAAGATAGFWDIHPTGIVNFDDRLGVRFSCADPDGSPDVAAWMQSRCALFLGWADERRGAANNSASWGPCPQASGGDLGAQRCISSAGDGRFHAMLLGGTVDDNDDFGIAFVCRDADAPRRAASVQGAVAYWLAFDKDGTPIRDASASWDACPGQGVDNTTDERCAGTGGDGLFHGFRGRNGPSSSWSFGIGVSPR